MCGRLRTLYIPPPTCSMHMPPHHLAGLCFPEVLSATYLGLYMDCIWILWSTYFGLAHCALVGVAWRY